MNDDVSLLWQSHYLACMTAILKQMDDTHYAHYISTFKTRQDIVVSVLAPPTLALKHLINSWYQTSQACHRFSSE